MKSKKLLSLICAFSMAATMVSSFVVAQAADQPTVALEFTGFEEMGSNVVASVDVKVSWPRTFSAYNEEFDVNTFETKYTGDFLMSAGIDIAFDNANTDYQWVKALSTVNEAFLLNDYNSVTKAISLYKAETQMANGYSGESAITLGTLKFRVINTKATLDLNVAGATSDGIAYTDNVAKPWSYVLSDFAVTGCTIPAYEPEPAITVKAVNVTPATATVAGEAQETFTAEVIGSDDNPYSDQNVTWSATAGTITEEGVFTAPAATDEDQTITIKATSVADDSVSGTATVTVPKKDEPQPQQPTTDITGAAVEKGVYFDVTMNGNGESITDANVVVAGPTEDGEGKEVTFKVINYGDIQGELSFIIGILTDIAGDYKGTSNVTTGVGTATDSATVAFPAQ